MGVVVVASRDSTGIMHPVQRQERLDSSFTFDCILSHQHMIQGALIMSVCPNALCLFTLARSFCPARVMHTGADRPPPTPCGFEKN